MSDSMHRSLDAAIGRQASVEQVEAASLAERLAETLAAHPMIATLGGCLCGANRSEIRPSGVAIREHRAHVAATLLPVVREYGDKRAREGLLLAVDRVQDVYDYAQSGARGPHLWWSTVLGVTLRDLRDRADRIGGTP